MICSFEDRSIGQSAEMEANARLIVAAPRLLDELKSLVAWVEEDKERAESFERQLNNAKDAIAKAEGVERKI